MLKKLKNIEVKIPLFIEEGIEQKLNQIFDSEIKLNSGGYLVLILRSSCLNRYKLR